jgi:hypothetical protein
MYEVSFSNQYLKEYKLCLRRKNDISFSDAVLISLVENGTVPSKHKPHLFPAWISPKGLFILLEKGQAQFIIIFRRICLPH